MALSAIYSLREENKYPHMLMALSLIENVFDGIKIEKSVALPVTKALSYLYSIFVISLLETLTYPTHAFYAPN